MKQAKPPQIWIQMWICSACRTLEFQPSCACRFVPFPLLLQKANPAPALGTFPFPGREKNHPGHHLSAPPAASEPGRFPNPIFDTGEQSHVPRSPLAHIFISPPAEFQSEHPKSPSTAGTRGCVIRLSVTGHKGRAQPCPGPAASTHSSYKTSLPSL